MLKLDKTRFGEHRPPVLQVVICPVTLAIPAFLIVSPGVGTQQYATWFQGGVQFAQHLFQLLRRYVEQRGVGEDAVEVFCRQFKLEKVLMPYFTATVLAGHLGEAFSAVEPDRYMPQAGEGLQIAPRAAAKIQKGKWRAALDMPQQCVDVLAHVVVASPFAKAFGTLLIMLQRGGSNLFEGFCIEGHGRLGRRQWPPTIPQRLFSTRARRSPPS